MKFIIATTLLTGLTALPNGFSYFADQNSLASPGLNGQQASISSPPSGGQAPNSADPSNQSGDGKTDRFWGGFFPWGGYYPYGNYYSWGGYSPYYSYGYYGPYWRSNIDAGADKAGVQDSNQPSA